jgi:hypothetical protein
MNPLARLLRKGRRPQLRRRPARPVVESLEGRQLLAVVGLPPPTGVTANLGAQMAPAGGDPRGYSWTIDNEQHVVFTAPVRSPSGILFDHIYEEVDNGYWMVTDLTAKLGGWVPIGSVSGYAWEVDNSEHIVYTGADHNVHELAEVGGNWARFDLTTGGNVINDPTGFSFGSAEHVLYTSVDARGNESVHELYNYYGYGWKPLDVTYDFGYVPIAGDIAFYTSNVDHTMDFTYRDQQGNVYHTANDGNVADPWSFQDLTQLLHLPVHAISDPSGFTWSSNGTQHVIFCGGDHDVYEVWANPTGSGSWQWSAKSLTMSAPILAPKAQGGAMGFENPADHSEDVIYSVYGTGHLVELSYDGSGTAWVYTDLTNVSGVGQLPTGNAYGFAYGEDGSTRVLFRGTNGRLYELRNHRNSVDASIWDATDLTQAAKSGVIVVHNTNPATLDSAVSYATAIGWSTIGFDPSLAGEFIPRTSALTLSGSIELDAPAGGLTLAGSSVNGGFSVVTDTPNSTAVITGLSIMFGYSQYSGGGILNAGTLTLDGCKLMYNTAQGGGGGVENDGHLTLDGCFLLANSAHSGGAVYNSAKGWGFVADDCNFTTNRAYDGGAIDSVTDSSAPVIIQNSTLWFNSAYNEGGAIYDSGAPLSLVSCWVGENQASDGGGLYLDYDSTAYIILGALSYNTSSVGNPDVDGPGVVHRF